MNMKHLLRRMTGQRGPSFFPSWQNQKYGKLPADLSSPPGSFVIAGLPKSGNVWLTSLVADCLDLPSTQTAGRTHVYYTHKALSPRLLYDPTLYRGVVIVRDLRDVVVSLYHWLKTEDYVSYYKHGPHHVYLDITSMYVEYFLRRFCNIPIATLVDDYVTKGWPVVRYENLWDRPEAELRRLFQIWQIDVADEKIRSAIERNSISTMRARIATGSVSTVEPVIRADHFRVGGYGNYRRELPRLVVSDLERRFGEYLVSWGYDLETTGQSAANNSPVSTRL